MPVVRPLPVVQDRVTRLQVVRIRVEPSVQVFGPDRDDAAIVAEKILLQLAEPVQLSVSQVKVGASIGIALYPDDGIDSNGLLKSADSLMYLAKQSGKGQYRFSR